MVIFKENNPLASVRTVHRLTKEPVSFCHRWIKHYAEHGNVNDGFRSGRQRKLDDGMLVKAQELGAEKSTGTSRLVAARLQADYGVSVSPRTIRRNFSEKGLVWEGPKMKPMLTATHKNQRLEWAAKHLRNKTSFAGWMFTDSCIFLVNRTKGSATVKCWHPRGRKPAEAVAKASVGVHVYMGVTKNGLTNLIHVTGAGGKASEYRDPRTGKRRPGVCAEEVVDVVLPQELADGDRLFERDKRWADSWIFQQDNAPVHTAKITQAYLKARMGKRLADWPPNSPDLSWIENIWGWAAEKLQRRADAITTADQLFNALREVLATISAETFQSYVKGMRKRLQAVVDAGGDSIGK